MSNINKRPSESTSANQPKKSNIEPDGNNSDGDSADEVIVEFEKTELNDVFTSEVGPSPAYAKTILEDYDNPVILIVTKKTRDNFMQFLKQFSGETVHHHEQATSPTHMNTDTTHHTNTTRTSPEREVRNNTVTDTTEDTQTCEVLYDNIKTEALKHRFAIMQKHFDNIQKEFRENSLKENLETTEDTETFRKVRKALTDCYVFGHKTINLSYKILEGTHDYMIKSNLNVVPNRLDKSFVSKVIQKVENEIYNANVTLFNKTVEQCHTTFDSAYQLTQRVSNNIVAKAWRSVKLSNKDVRVLSFRDKRKNFDRDFEHTERHTDSNMRQDRHVRSGYTERIDETRRWNDRDLPERERTYRHRDMYRDEKTRRPTRREEEYRQRQDRQGYRDYQKQTGQHDRRQDEYYTDYDSDAYYKREFPRLQESRDYRRRRDSDYEPDRRRRKEYYNSNYAWVN